MIIYKMDMDVSVNIEKVDIVCRICLCEGANMKMLTSKMESDDRTIAEVLSFILNLYISESDAYAKQVCQECHAIIHTFDQFKKRCIQSEDTLNDAYYGERKVEMSEFQDSKSCTKEVSFNKFCMDKPYQCSVCSKKFSDLLLLESHVLTVHSLESEQLTKDIPLTDNISQYPNYAVNTSIYNNSALEIDNDFKEKKEEIDDNFDFTESPCDLSSPLMNCNTKVEEDAICNVNTTIFKCKCGTIYDNYAIYKEHLQESKCNEVFNNDKKSKSVDKKNDKKIVEKVNPVCQKCNIEFNTIKRYKMHLRMHRFENIDPSDIFNCSMCMRRFTRKSSYTAHLKTHEIKAGIKYICNTCKREFQHQAHLDNHILSVHTKETGFTCEYCSKNFATQESLNNHYEAHKIEKRHQCHVCKKAFFMLSTLKDHIRTHTGEKPFLCSACGKGFSQKNNLTQHMRRHQGLKLFKCEHCDQRFVSKGELVAHNRKHSGAHPFVCDECGNSFTTSSSLVKHRRIHTGERPYACDLCNMKFSASGTLKNHRRIHTGEKPYQCSHCEKAFVQRQDLISHIRCHTGERPFVCPNCGQAFRKAAALKGHLKMHAKEPLSMQKDGTLSVLHSVNILIT